MLLTGLLLIVYLAYFLIAPKPTNLVTVGPICIIKQENESQANLMEMFLQLSSLFQNGLCQIDNKT